MNILIIICSGILGTTVMTSFSQVLGLFSKYRFNEVHLLNMFVNRSKYSTSDIGKNYILGWIIHYLIGICMAAALYCYYSFVLHSNIVWTGIILGFILGIIGIAGWSLLIGFYSNAPKVEWKYFFYPTCCGAHILCSVDFMGIS